MKMNQIIRKKRKELSLTQEQIADFLGVSAPAVNKWEKGNSYPDITLLPALARLLKTDLNTLMSFNDDLTDIEIENFVDSLDKIVQEQNYEIAFQEAMAKIQEYPTCDKLIYSAVIYLEGALFLYSVSEPERYREKFEMFYKRLTASEIPEIRDTAALMIISYARNRNDFSKAEELIKMLPSSAIDKEEQLAVLYQCQKQYEDAGKIWEHRILGGVSQLQTALVNLLEIALFENNRDSADFLADLYETVTRQFSLPEWMCYNAHLLLAIDRKDQKESLSILSKMLPAMKEEWSPQNCRLYHNLKDSGTTSLSIRLADTLCNDLINKEEYAFLRDCTEFQALIAQMKPCAL